MSSWQVEFQFDNFEFQNCQPTPVVIICSLQLQINISMVETLLNYIHAFLFLYFISVLLLIKERYQIRQIRLHLSNCIILKFLASELCINVNSPNEIVPKKTTLIYVKKSMFTKN